MSIDICDEDSYFKPTGMISDNDIDNKSLEFIPPGFSADSKILVKIISETYDAVTKGVNNMFYEQAMASLETVYHECSMEDWDGYGAAPISATTYEIAKKFLNLCFFDKKLPMPAIVPEPSGNIGLEWYSKENYVFIVSLEDKNVMSFAGIFGEKNKVYGSEFFIAKIPDSVSLNINRVIKGI